ncbi:MAG TPA: glycosyltransferase family 4 protein [Candidatus Binataceae bacterium]|nr:glycosyltransferase family 4 protein [Candidatus Binataceae bacterium]
MRIALLVDAFRSLGGIEEIVDYLSAEFIRSGHQVTIVSTPYFETGCERRPRTTAECLYFEIPSRKPVSLRHLERIVKQPRALEFTEYLGRERPDVVNSHIWQWDKFPTIASACRSAGVPFVQSFDTDEWGRGKLGVRALRALDSAAAFTVLSGAVRNNLSGLIPAIANAHLITGGVDCTAAEAAPAHHEAYPYIFSAARLDLKHKAIDILIDAFAKISNELSDLRLLIAGDGPDRGAIEARAHTAGLAERIVMLGALSHEELWSFYKGARIFAMPSRQGEAMGLVFLEAMACGIPVIATRSGGVSEVVCDGQTGILTTPDDTGELAAALLRLMHDPARALEMGLKAKSVAASEYSWTAVAQQYLQVYSSCLA